MTSKRRIACEHNHLIFRTKGCIASLRNIAEQVGYTSINWKQLEEQLVTAIKAKRDNKLSVK